MRRALLGCAVAICIGAPASAETVRSANSAILRGLDKIDGKLADVTLAAGATARIGRLSITLRDCRYPQASPSSNAYAYLTITDTSISQIVFEGWMVASSPALNSLDHPRYDVWVLRCNTS